MLLHGVKRDRGSGRMGVAGAQAVKDWAERLGASGSRPSMDMEVRCPGGRGARALPPYTQTKCSEQAPAHPQHPPHDPKSDEAVQKNKPNKIITPPLSLDLFAAMMVKLSLGSTEQKHLGFLKTAILSIINNVQPQRF